MSRSLRSCLLLLGMLALPAIPYILSSCTLVNDPVVSFAKKNVGRCVKDCRHEFQAADRECLKEFRQDRRGCRRLPAGPAQDACFQELRNDLVTCTDAALDDWRTCLNDCHTQGQGRVQ